MNRICNLLYLIPVLLFFSCKDKYIPVEDDLVCPLEAQYPKKNYYSKRKSGRSCTELDKRKISYPGPQQCYSYNTQPVPTDPTSCKFSNGLLKSTSNHPNATYGDLIIHAYNDFIILNDKNTGIQIQKIETQVHNPIILLDGNSVYLAGKDISSPNIRSVIKKYLLNIDSLTLLTTTSFKGTVHSLTKKNHELSIISYYLLEIYKDSPYDSIPENAEQSLTMQECNQINFYHDGPEKSLTLLYTYSLNTNKIDLQTALHGHFVISDFIESQFYCSNDWRNMNILSKDSTSTFRIQDEPIYSLNLSSESIFMLKGGYNSINQLIKLDLNFNQKSFFMLPPTHQNIKVTYLGNKAFIYSSLKNSYESEIYLFDLDNFEHVNPIQYRSQGVIDEVVTSSENEFTTFSSQRDYIDTRTYVVENESIELRSDYRLDRSLYLTTTPLIKDIDNLYIIPGYNKNYILKVDRDEVELLYSSYRYFHQRNMHIAGKNLYLFEDDEMDVISLDY